MDDRATGGGPLMSGSECAALMPPPAFGTGPQPGMQQMMMINGPPSYWSHQQMAAATNLNNNNHNDTSSMHQQLDMPASTSQQQQNPGNFQQMPLQFPQAAAEMQFKQFQEFQRRAAAASQQFPNNHNFSPEPGRYGGGVQSGNEMAPRFGAGQQSQQIQQQISSPSISSTADLLANGSHGNGVQQQFQHYGGGVGGPFGFHPPNCFNGCSPELNNVGVGGGAANCVGDAGGNCNSPMVDAGQNHQTTNLSGQQSFPSAGQQQKMQIMAAQQQQQKWSSSHPQMMSTASGQFVPNGHCFGTNNGTSPRQHQLMGPPLPPMMMMVNGGGGSSPMPFGRRSFLFTSDMANKAASDIHRCQAGDMAFWHLHNLGVWHSQNPSTSTAIFEQQMAERQQQQQMNTNTMNPSPGSAVQPPASRTNKRKASAHTTTPQEQQPHSLSSPSYGLPGVVCQPQSVPGFIDAQQQQQRHSSMDLCDSSTNGDMAMFKRPPSRLPNQQNGNAQNYLSPNPGQQPMGQQHCFGRMEDENPLRKMEMMTSKTLNDQMQPANKMARLMGGTAVADEQQDEISKQNNLQEKMRKLQEMEKSLSSLTGDSISPNPGQQMFCHPGGQMMQQNGGFCPPPGAPMPPQFMPGPIDPAQMAQFRPPYFPAGQMIPQFHGHPMQMPPMGVQPQQQHSPSTSSANTFCPPPPPFALHGQRMAAAGPNSTGMRMPNIGPNPMFCAGDMQQHQQQMGMPPNGLIRPPGDFPMGGFWMPPGGVVQSLNGLDSRVPSMKMQHLPNGQQQIMAASSDPLMGGQ